MKKINNDSQIITGPGYFLEIYDKFIPFKKCLLTSNTIFYENDIKINKNINIKYKNEQKIIEKKNERKIYSNKTLDYICIEIFDEDGIKDFFQVEKCTFEEKRNYFNNHEIYIPQYLKNNDLSFSSGKILSLEKDKMTYNCSLTKGSKGLPILSLELNLSIIAIQTGNDEENKCHIATPIVDIINDIKHKACPLGFDEKEDEEDFLDEVRIKILMYFLKIDENLILSFN